MKKQLSHWTLTHTKDLTLPFTDPVSATVPCEIQLAYAAAKAYAPYTYGLNFRQFDWMEQEYFRYETVLDFTAADGQRVYLTLESVDYRYTVMLGGSPVAEDEGIFTPVRLDVTAYAGKPTLLQVILHPVPCHPGEKPGRSQARYCCKPPSSYGWDWHPRLIPRGILGPVTLDIVSPGDPLSTEVCYTLSEDLACALICFEAEICPTEKTQYILFLTDPEGKTVLSNCFETGGDALSRQLSLPRPRLWYPRSYGDQPIYILTLQNCATGIALSRKIGFRRCKLVRNTDDIARFEANFPKTSLPAPATVEINGVTVFAKGSNWVNAEIFPTLITDDRLTELLQLAYDANMNMLRLWGGQYINREYFYDLCDHFGIMVWQEFMLSCNNYPDDARYLSVLEKEAFGIIRRLRTHPCLTLWAGGNELFNSWSGMTSQSHALRLLDKLCYELDRDTPFNMTSPVQGMAHGSYVKTYPTEDGGTEEFLQVLKRTDYNTYTEFGCNGGAEPAYIKQFIMSEKDYEDCRPENEVWREHHAFGAWGDGRWLGTDEIAFYFGGWQNTDDLMEKTLYLQAMTYQTMFEEMRRHWPRCSMAINWDFNEPWPCAAGNSLVNWPSRPKEALSVVGRALRPTLVSLCCDKNRWLTGETVNGSVWVLNDAPTATNPLTVQVVLRTNGVETPLAECAVPGCKARQNAPGSGFQLPVTADLPERFWILLRCADHPEWDSGYRFVHRK